MEYTCIPVIYIDRCTCVNMDLHVCELDEIFQLGGIFDPKRPLYETLENMVFANTKFSFPQDIYQAYAYTCTSYTAGSRGCSLVNVL